MTVIIQHLFGRNNLILSDMAKDGINKVTGHANPGMQQFQQIATALATKNFYGFMPINDDATLSVLTDVNGASRTGDFDGTTVYQNVYYPGNFASIQLSAGKAIIYLNEQ